MTNQEPLISINKLPDDPATLLADIREQALFYPGRQQTKNLDLLKHLSRYSSLMLTITGPQGSGKTHLKNQLLGKLDSGVQATALDARHYPDAPRLLTQLESALQLQLPPNADQETYLSEIRQHVGLLNDDGGSCLLLVDSAEYLEASALDILLKLGMTANENQRPHLILFGQDALLQKLNSPENQARFESIGHHIALEPFSLIETRAYLEYRCRSVGINTLPITDKQVAQLYQSSGGWPGALNEGLLQLVSRQSATPGRNMTKTTEETDAAPQSTSAKPAQTDGRKKTNLTLIALLLLGLAGVFLVTAWLYYTPESSTRPAATTSNVAGNLIARSQELRQQSQQPPVTALPVPVQTPAPASLPDEPATPMPPPVATPSQPVTATPAVPAETLDSRPPATNPVSQAAPAPLDSQPVLENRGYRREAWLMERNPQHYTLQMMGSLEENSVLAFIEQQEDKRAFVYFEGRHQNRPWYVLTYGSYASREAALAAINQLPSSLRNQRPWARSFQSVQEDIRKRL